MRDYLDPFRIEVVDQGNKKAIKLFGFLSEAADFSALDLGGVDQIDVDFAEVRLVNSTGLKIWVEFLSNFKPGVQFRFYNCRKFIVDQINILRGFTPVSATIESLYTPYFCEKCDELQSVLCKRGKDYLERKGETPGFLKLKEMIPCPDCQSPMIIDVLSKSYFHFLDL